MSKTKDVQEAETVDRELSTQVSFSVMPASVGDLIKLSEMIAASDLAPKDFKGKAGNCYIAIQMGAELELNPMQAIQNIAVINGKPTLYGDIGKALLLKNGCRIMERDIKDIKATGEAWCEITRPDGKTKAIRTFSIDDAKTANLWGKVGPWKTDPYRMLAWRAFWFCARDIAADFLKGLRGAEEVRDYVDTELVTNIPEPKRKSEAAETASAPAPEGQPDAQGLDSAGVSAQKAPDGFIPMDSKVDGGTCQTASCHAHIARGEPIWYDKNNKRAYCRKHFVS